MFDKIRKARQETPQEYLADLKKAFDKAVASGVSPELVALATMDFGCEQLLAAGGIEPEIVASTLPPEIADILRQFGHLPATAQA